MSTGVFGTIDQQTGQCLKIRRLWEFEEVFEHHLKMEFQLQSATQAQFSTWLLCR